MFKGKTVLITGASSGIGAAAALKFYELGACVALVGRNEDNLQAAIKNPDKGSVSHIVCNVRKEDDVRRAVSHTIEKFGQLDVLVNNAGVLVGGAADQTSNECWNANLETNAHGPFFFLRECAPHLIKTKGSIVNVSSANGMQSFQNCMAYCVSKAALDMMTKCAAIDLAAKGVRVNSVNPGVTRSELQKRGGLTDRAYMDFLERSASVTHPLGRIAEPNEIAEAIVFLADSQRSGFITGAVLPVDGGRVCLGAR